MRIWKLPIGRVDAAAVHSRGSLGRAPQELCILAAAQAPRKVDLQPGPQIFLQCTAGPDETAGLGSLGHLYCRAKGTGTEPEAHLALRRK